MSVNRGTKEELEGAMEALLPIVVAAQSYHDAFRRPLLVDVVLGGTGGMIVSIETLSILQVIPFCKPATAAIGRQNFSGCYLLEQKSHDILSNFFAVMSTVEDRMVKAISFEFSVKESEEQFVFKTGRRQIPMNVGAMRMSTAQISDGIRNIKKNLASLLHGEAAKTHVSVIELLSRKPSVQLVKGEPQAVSPPVILPVRGARGLPLHLLLESADTTDSTAVA